METNSNFTIKPILELDLERTKRAVYVDVKVLEPVAWAGCSLLCLYKTSGSGGCGDYTCVLLQAPACLTKEGGAADGLL